MADDASGLTQAQKDECRDVLAEKRRQLNADLERLRAELAERSDPQRSAGAPSDVPTHEADVGTETFDRELHEKLIEDHENRLLAVDEALKRLDAGTYGTCSTCGGPIGMERLRAKPWATCCRQHAAEEETPGPGDRRTPKPWIEGEPPQPG
ncbi:MAG: TraR/DksA C4-type zinc finger protein [Phycisphaerae bacterium]